MSSGFSHLPGHPLTGLPQWLGPPAGPYVRDERGTRPRPPPSSHRRTGRHEDVSPRRISPRVWTWGLPEGRLPRGVNICTSPHSLGRENGCPDSPIPGESPLRCVCVSARSAMTRGQTAREKHVAAARFRRKSPERSTGGVAAPPRLGRLPVPARCRVDAAPRSPPRMKPQGALPRPRQRLSQSPC